MTLPRDGLLAVLHLEKSLAAIKEAFGRDLFATHEPLPLDPSHAELHGYSHEDEAIADELARSVVEIYPARAPSA